MECLHQCCCKLRETNQQEIVVTVKSLQSFGNRVIYAAIEDDSAKEQLVHLAGKFFLRRGDLVGLPQYCKKCLCCLSKKLSPLVQGATLPTNLRILICSCKQASIPPHTNLSIYRRNIPRQPYNIIVWHFIYIS